MDPRNFFTELKRRTVYKVAIAYAVVGWLFIQVSSTILPTFHAPEWVVQTLIVIVALGFPIALVIAWAFEMTPEGMKRTENVSPDEKIPQWSARKSAASILVVVICAAALLGYQVFRTQPTPVTGPVSEESIAVLPLVNQSGDPGQPALVSSLVLNPVYKPYYSDPRFIALCNEIGLHVPK